MGKRYPVLGVVLIILGGAGLLLLSVGDTWGPEPGWAPSMMGPGMMGGAIPSDIRYEALTKEEHRAGEKAREHPPYTDALIKRAITQGVDPAGNSLDWTMPRWRMAEEDLADLLAYLRTLR